MLDRLSPHEVALYKLGRRPDHDELVSWGLNCLTSIGNHRPVAAKFAGALDQLAKRNRQKQPRHPSIDVVINHDHRSTIHPPRSPSFNNNSNYSKTNEIDRLHVTEVEPFSLEDLLYGNGIPLDFGQDHYFDGFHGFVA